MRALAFAVGLILLGWSIYKIRLRDPIESLRLSLAVDSWHRLAHYEAVGIEHSFFEGETRGQRLRVELLRPVNEDQAQGIFRDQRREIEEVYRRDRLPYFGAVTQEFECPAQLRPQFSELSGADQQELRVELSTNDRLTYGVCDPSSVSYRALFRILYCRRTKVLLILKNYRLESQVKEPFVTLSFLCQIIR